MGELRWSSGSGAAERSEAFPLTQPLGSGGPPSTSFSQVSMDTHLFTGHSAQTHPAHGSPSSRSEASEPGRRLGSSVGAGGDIRGAWRGRSSEL